MKQQRQVVLRLDDDLFAKVLEVEQDLQRHQLIMTRSIALRYLLRLGYTAHDAKKPKRPGLAKVRVKKGKAT